MAQTLNIALKNTTSSTTAYAYITGFASNNGNALFLLQADGRTPYYPPSPPPESTLNPLGANCAIPLGPPGSSVNVVVPLIESGRIWFSIDKTLIFLLNPGTQSDPRPQLVSPSVSNRSDPNIQTYWDFCEFTFNSSQLYANITYVDFVCIPISMTLTNSSGTTKHVSGLPANGLDIVCAGLMAQKIADGADWDKLIVTSGGQNLRALSPNNGIVMNSSLFSGYYEPYVNEVWSKYSGIPLSINTQAGWGTVTGKVLGSMLSFSGVDDFGKPSTADIFGCSTGPFIDKNNKEIGALGARLAAAFNRSTLLTNSNQPSGSPADYYKHFITNHYSRIVHAASLDGRGYAFPYDDVVPDGGTDQSGAVFDPNPLTLTVTLGGDTSPTTTTISAYSQIPAAMYTSNNGTQTQATSDIGGGSNVGWIQNGNWLGYTNIDFGNRAATQFIARVASDAANGVSGLVQVALDSPNAPPIGAFAIGNTGGWQSWKTVPTNISPVTGIHTVYLIFTSGQPSYFVNVHWFTFASPTQTIGQRAKL